MNYTNIYNQIDTQDDFINCDKFIDIDCRLLILTIKDHRLI